MCEIRYADNSAAPPVKIDRSVLLVHSDFILCLAVSGKEAILIKRVCAW